MDHRQWSMDKPEFSTPRVQLCYNLILNNNSRPYICSVIGSRHNGIKREVRCNSGAIPVAVSSFRECEFTIGLLDLQTTVPLKAGWEGIQAESEPEDLPVTSALFTAFG